MSSKKKDPSPELVTMFEKIDQERMKMVEKTHALEINCIRNETKITVLESELDKANSVISEMKKLLQSQRKFIGISMKQQTIMIKQQKMISQYRKMICRLRVRNRRPEQKTEEANNTEKLKYTKDMMDQALKVVLGGESLGKAAKRFGVPKESLRQAKLRAGTQAQ